MSRRRRGEGDSAAQAAQAAGKHKQHNWVGAQPSASLMGASASLPEVVWKTFGALLVLPIQHKLRVFSVLVKERDSFTLIGDLGSLCTEGESKVFLQDVIAHQEKRYITSKELGSIDRLVENDSRWSSRLLAFQNGFAAGLQNVDAWRITVPEHQWVFAEEGTSLRDLLNKFVPDDGDLHFKRGRTLDLWIVTEVITAPSLTMYALNGKGADIGFSVTPPAPLPVPVDVQITLGGEGRAKQFISIAGPELDDTIQPFPFAFRGWKCTYKSGFLKKWKPARLQADSFDVPPLNGTPERPIRNARCATPLADPDMADFVGEDDWVTTIRDPAKH